MLDLAPAHIGTGRSRTISAWIAGLPAKWVGDNGWLLYWRGVSSFGHWEEKPLEYLERAYKLFERNADAQGIYLSWAAAVQGVVQDGTDFRRLDRWLDRFESLEKTGVACPEPFLPMVATGMMLASAFRRLEGAHNRKWVDRAMVLGEKSHDFAHRIMNGGFAAMYFALYERPARAKPILQTLRDLAEWGRALHVAGHYDWSGARRPALGWRVTTRGASLSSVKPWLSRRARASSSGTTICWGSAWQLALAWKTSARFRSCCSRWPTSRGGGAAFRHRRTTGTPVGMHKTGVMPRAHGTTQSLATAIAEKEGPPFGHTVALILLAQAQWMSGRPREAAAALSQAKQRAEEAACALHLHTCYLIESDLLWDEDRTRALSCLKQSFGYAEEGGYYNAIALNRRTLERAVVRALEHGIAVEYVLARIRKNGLRPADLPQRLEIWPWRYRFRLFGSFEVVAGDGSSPTSKEPFVLRGMPRRLLEALLVFGARGVRDVQLIDTLWPDAEGDAGRRVFDTTLHRLRRQLGDGDVLRMNDGRLYLDERSCWLDTWAFDDLTAEAERQIAQPGSGLEPRRSRSANRRDLPRAGAGRRGDRLALGSALTRAVCEQIPSRRSIARPCARTRRKSARSGCSLPAREGRPREVPDERQPNRWPAERRKSLDSE